MSFADYILKDLNSLKQNSINKVSDPEEVVALIYKFLMSKKFRKYSVTPSYQEHILSAIKNSVAKNEPIKLTLVFGGYKLWRLEESPEVDWAELFSLIYYTKWLKPVLEVYEPGVWFDFFSDDVILERMNNIPKNETEAYTQSFKKLLAFIKPYIPENLNFTFNRVGEQYDSLEDFNKELDQTMKNIEKEIYNIPLTAEQIITIESNVKLNPGQSDDPLWKEKVNLIHEAYSRASKRRPYYRNAEKIMVVNTPIKDSLAVGTTKRSVAKFWFGVGIIQKEQENYSLYVYSPKQLEANNFIKEDVSVPGLESKNFKAIKIISI